MRKLHVAGSMLGVLVWLRTKKCDAGVRYPWSLNASHNVSRLVFRMRKMFSGVGLTMAGGVSCPNARRGSETPEVTAAPPRASHPSRASASRRDKPEPRCNAQSRRSRRSAS
jgi:hypothetical protein